MLVQGLYFKECLLLSQKQFLDNWTTHTLKATSSMECEPRLTGIVWRLACMHHYKQGYRLESFCSLKCFTFNHICANSVGWWANEQGGRRHKGSMLKLMVVRNQEWKFQQDKCEDNTDVERGQLHVAKDKSSPRVHPVFAYIDFVQDRQPSIHKWITLQTFHS